MLNSSEFDPGVGNGNSFLKWGSVQPNNYNGVEDCVIISTTTQPATLNDFNCDAVNYNDYKFFGLCEIPRFTCS